MSEPAADESLTPIVLDVLSSDVTARLLGLLSVLYTLEWTVRNVGISLLTLRTKHPEVEGDQDLAVSVETISSTLQVYAQAIDQVSALLKRAEQTQEVTAPSVVLH